MTWSALIEETYRAWIGAGLVIAAVAVFVCTVLAAERRANRRKRPATLSPADVERDRLAAAGREVLHLDERDLRPPTQLERILRDHQDAETLRAALNEEADRQVFNGRQPAAYADDLHDVFPKENE